MNAASGKPAQGKISHNMLLARLTHKDRVLAEKKAQWVDLELHHTLWAQGDKLEYVYFPTSGYVSLIAHADSEHAMEVGMVGTEGMLGTGVGLGVMRAPVQALVQEAGHAWRMRSADFAELLHASGTLNRVMGRFTFVTMSQLAYASACVRFHQVDQRLARWLLMCHDRSPGNVFPMTHVFLAAMLGVRRVSVTNAATAMHAAGLIDYHRGMVQVLNRPGLEATACNCYQRDRDCYDATFSLPIQRSTA